ncbi:MAG: hypothetical protein PVF96_06895 [Candidatus Bathyarchaeota archaeon]|jgi:hypothetical protein
MRERKTIKKNIEDLLTELVKIDKEIARKVKELKNLMINNGDWERYVV